MVIIGLAGTLPRSPATAQPGIGNAFPQLGFNNITDLQAPPDGTNRFFAVERAGAVRVFESDPATATHTTFLDLSGSVDTNGEGGLLGLAFHPDYAQSGYVFVYYTTSEGGPFRSVVSRFTVSDDPDVADSTSEQVVLTVGQPRTNHNAGQLQFGPDGYLYVGLGDGGGGGDPFENGQDRSTLLGSMLRLDVDLDGSGASPDCGTGAYEVPPDNPFLGDEAACDEIYAYGLRNPFRYSFGPEGRLWVADVGQNQREEINWVEAGGNYGWDVMEGEVCYEPSSGCDTSGLELPVFTYSHGVDRSITGGYVYTGSCGYLQGRYVYGDFVSGRIWALDYDASGATGNELLYDGVGNLTTFGVDPNEELYFAGFADDVIYRFNCSVLPVELTAFSGRADGRSVRLTWTTASETQNAGFEVQHAVGDRFETVGFLEGSGTTQRPRTYAFTVPDLAPGVHRFRLRQLDTDGSATYSPEVEVTVPLDAAYAVTAPHPNPARGVARFTVTVETAQPVTAALYDVTGRRVQALFAGVLSAHAPTPITVPTGALASGAYIIRVEGRAFVTERRLTVVRWGVRASISLRRDDAALSGPREA
jgi:glucose/arabinose dehydrogenase